MPTHNTPARRSALWWVATPLCLAYAAGVFALLVLRFLLLVWPPLLVLVSFLGPFLYAPLILFLPLAFLGRSRAAIGATLAVLVLFLVTYLPLFLPRVGAAPPAAGSPITAMTFNLGASRSSAGRLAQAIADANADIVAVQELVTATAQGLSQELGGRYPYRILDPSVASSGMLSRYPILSSEWFRPAGHGRPALHAVVDVGGVPMHIIIVHPEPPGIVWYRHTRVPVGVDDRSVQEQASDVARRAAALPGLVMVLGDFNMGEQSPAYARLTARLADAFREAGFGFGFTFPHDLVVDGISLPGPLVRIDYIFHNDALYARRAYVGCQGGSDHCYVAAELSLTPR